MTPRTAAISTLMVLACIIVGMIWYIGSKSVVVPIIQPVIDTVFIPTPIQTITPVHALRSFTYSHYWPAWGGVNGNPNGTLGTTGLPWRPWAYKAIACPQTPEFPNWTKIMIVRPAVIAGEWTCLDHGSYIVVGKAPNGYGYPGVAWLDFLRPEFDVPYGSLIYGYMEGK